VSSIHIAIDPGKNGGIAVSTGCASTARAYSMPGTAHDLAALLSDVSLLGDAEVVLEKVHAMPKDGGSSAFTFGENFGVIQGVLAALMIPYRFVTPQQWQKKVGALSKDKAERKRELKAFAQQRYPHIAVTLKTADALAMLAVEFTTKG
jgi:crossover junction endodeoxyribonuclease RuvC